MELTIGAVLEGKVKSITNFGAFVALPDNKTGMVHISEIANAYVSDIRQHLTEGQDVKVMVIAIDPAGKINLSMKRLEPKPQNAERPARPNNNFRRDNNRDNNGQNNANGAPAGQSRPAATRPAAPVPPPAPKTADQLFEEKLKAFMSESDSKLSSMRADHRTKSRRR